MPSRISRIIKSICMKTKEKNMRSYSIASPNKAKTCACDKFLGNIKRKWVERYGDLTLMNISINYTKLYEKYLTTRKLICYRTLSQMPPFFMIEDVYLWLKNLASQKEWDVQFIRSFTCVPSWLLIVQHCGDIDVSIWVGSMEQ